MVYLTADKKGALSFKGSLSRPEKYETHAEKDHLMMTGTMDNGRGGEGLRYAVRLKAIATGGNVAYSNDVVEVQNADEVLLILTASTNHRLEFPSYRGADPSATSLEQLKNISSHPFSALLNRHVNDYSRLFGKVSLKLSDGAADTVPTDVRLKNQKDNPDDLHLQEVYFLFQRLQSAYPGQQLQFFYCSSTPGFPLLHCIYLYQQVYPI